MKEILGLAALLPYAFFSSLMMSVAFGYMSSFLILRRQSFLADTVAHASLLGVAIGFCFGVAPQAVLVPFSVFLGLLITWMAIHPQQDTVAVSAMIFSTCAGLGAVLLGLKGIGGQEFVHVLLGDLLWVSASDFVSFVVICAGVLGFVFVNRKQLTLVLLNREMAIASGIRPERYEYLFSACVALLIAVSIKLVGVFLVTALAAVPPLIAARFATSFRGQLLGSTAVSLGLTLIGFFFALAWDLPFGPAISSLLGGTAFLCQFLTRQARSS